MMNSMHTRQWEEFLQLDAQKRQQQLNQKMATSGYGGFKQQAFSDHDGFMVNPQYAGSKLAMDSRNRSSNPLENYTSRPRDNFGDIHRQRCEDYGKPYNPY